MPFDLDFQMANWLGAHVFFGLHLFSHVSCALRVLGFLVRIVSVLLRFCFVYAGVFFFASVHRFAMLGLVFVSLFWS